mgnify:CR=1 FL=1
MNIEDPIYEAITDSIRVNVSPHYLHDQSRPQEGHFVWAYVVNVTNEGDDAVQLKRRHWKITDARGLTTEVEGEGVIGEQPLIEPGDSFEYTSGTPLATPHGIMRGEYQMQEPGGRKFQVEIPAFALDQPENNILAN